MHFFLQNAWQLNNSLHLSWLRSRIMFMCFRTKFHPNTAGAATLLVLIMSCVCRFNCYDTTFGILLRMNANRTSFGGPRRCIVFVQQVAGLGAFGNATTRNRFLPANFFVPRDQQPNAGVVFVCILLVAHYATDHAVSLRLGWAKRNPSLGF